MAKSTPAYEFPLTDEQLALVGKITLVFGQIDDQLTDLLFRLYRLNQEQFDTLFSGKMLSARLDAAEVALPLVANRPRGVESVRRFLKLARVIVPERNLVTHGSWGWHTSDFLTYAVGPFSASKPNQRLFAGQLSGLLDRSCAASVELAEALWDFAGHYNDPTAERPTWPAKLIFSDGPDRPTLPEHLPPVGELWTAGSIVRLVPSPTQRQRSAYEKPPVAFRKQKE